MINLRFRSDFRDRRLERLARRLNQRIDNAYGLIAANIRQNARKSIRNGTKTRPHSDPGRPVKTRKSAPVYRNTIERYYNSRTKTLIVGPKTRGFKNRKDNARPTAGTIPRTLEYGGYLRASSKTVIHKSKADPRAATIAWKKQRSKWQKKPRWQRLDPTGKYGTVDGRFLKGRDFQWVFIEAGTRKIEQRPTMRLAFNKSVNQRGMRKHFLAIGTQLSSDGSLRGSLKFIGPTF